MSILAGIMISIGCVLYLTIGGLPGAVMFSLGLMSVILFQLKLFTGKAGNLTEKKIKIGELGLIWIGNLIGCAILAGIIYMSPNSQSIFQNSSNIMAARESAGFLGSFLLAIPCGLLMYFAVNAKNLLKIVFAAMCVSGFIMGGFYHCVADMFYTITGAQNLHQWCNVLFVTAGNIVGCNLYPIVRKIIESKVPNETVEVELPTEIHQDAIYNPDIHEPHQEVHL